MFPFYRASLCQFRPIQNTPNFTYKTIQLQAIQEILLLAKMAYHIFRAQSLIKGNFIITLLLQYMYIYISSDWVSKVPGNALKI